MASKHNSKLTQEAIKLAKKMGVNLDGFEAEAEEIWKRLDDMAQNDPLEYENFIAQQYKQSQTVEEESSSHSRCFRPAVGFSFESTTIDGDGIKIRELGDELSGKKIFVNVCSHVCVDLPMDEFGTQTAVLSNSANGLQIPMAVGQQRDKLETIAVDVVVHPAVVQACSDSQHFKRQLIEVVVRSIEDELDLKLSTKTSDSKRPYNEGIGDDGNTPVLFFVDAENKRQSSKKEKESILNSPSGLIHIINQEKDATSSEIQLVGSNATLEKKMPQTQQSTAEQKPSAKPAISKGFLNKPSKPLYPQGSSEGAGSNTGGAFARIMSRCQVVNTADMKTTPPASQQNETMKPNINNLKNINVASSEDRRNLPSRQENADMEKLFSSLDEEFGKTANSLKSDEQFASVLADFAKVFTSDLSKVDAAEPSPSASNISSVATTRLQPCAACSASKEVNLTVKSNKSTNGKLTVGALEKDGRAVVKVTGFEKSFLMTDAELQVSDDAATIRLPDEIISVALRNGMFERDSCKASFSRKLGELKIAIGTKPCT